MVSRDAGPSSASSSSEPSATPRAATCKASTTSSRLSCPFFSARCSPEAAPTWTCGTSTTSPAQRWATSRRTVTGRFAVAGQLRLQSPSRFCRHRALVSTSTLLSHRLSVRSHVSHRRSLQRSHPCIVVRTVGVWRSYWTASRTTTLSHSLASSARCAARERFRDRLCAVCLYVARWCLH